VAGRDQSAADQPNNLAKGHPPLKPLNQPNNVDYREKVSFDIQPTNPQANITAAGHCEFWITTIDLMEFQEKSTLSSPDDTMLPEVNTDQCCATMVYGTVYGYTVRYGNTAYSRIYTVLDCIYGKIRYGVRYGPNFESLSQKFKIELCFSSANG
jgi:hypothetical protein